MPYDANLDDELSQNQGDLTSHGTETVEAGAQPQQEAEAAVAEPTPEAQAAQGRPTFTIRSLENLGRYVSGERIPVALDIQGTPRNRVEVEYSAECIDSGGDRQWDMSQVDLDESGHGKDEWAVSTEEAGRYLIEVRTTDSTGMRQTQQVLVEVVVPDGMRPAQAEQPAAEAKPAQERQDKQDEKVLAAAT